MCADSGWLHPHEFNPNHGEVPFLSIIMIFALMSVLYNINIFTPAHSELLKNSGLVKGTSVPTLPAFPGLRCLSGACEQRTVGACFGVGLHFMQGFIFPPGSSICLHALKVLRFLVDLFSLFFMLVLSDFLYLSAFSYD